MAYDFKDLMEPQNVESGLAEYAYIALLADIATLQTVTVPGVDPGDEVTVKTAHVMAANKYFRKVQLAPSKNSLTDKNRGDAGLSSSNAEFKLFIPGAYPQAVEQVRKWKNNPLIAIVEDSTVGTGIKYQVGNDLTAAWLVGDLESGTGKDGSKGWTITIHADTGVLFYDAAIPVEP